MADKLLREVQFIDGVQEFLEEGYIVELLAKDQNSFVLSGTPVEGSIRFSGDVSLFTKQVYFEEDLSIEGSWIILDNNLKINPNYRTSTYTYTYVSYKRKSTVKKEGLFSVDYDAGYIYTSTPIKNIRIDYKHAIQYAEAQKMSQVPPTEYTIETLQSMPIDDRTKMTYIYQKREETLNSFSKEYYKGGRLNLLTLGEKDE